MPSWLALYDIDDISTFKHESYTCLRANRSPREANLVQRLETLDRRTYELVADSGESRLTSSLSSKNPTRFIITHSVSSVNDTGRNSDEDFKIWSEKVFAHLRDASATGGWVRTRTYKCIDNLKTGISVGKGLDEQTVSKYLVVHGNLAPVIVSQRFTRCQY